MENIRRDFFSAREEITGKALRSKYSALNNFTGKRMKKLTPQSQQQNISRVETIL